MASMVIIIYGLTLLTICLFSLGQFNLAWHYLQSKKYQDQHSSPLATFPFVTVQLPVYNEKYVITRLIDAVSKLDYPMDRFEIQVLDDSTDETKRLIAEKIATVRRTGISIVQLCRKDRIGFKAGALAYGLERARGEFIVIFDADFIPSPDFLLATLPKFSSKNIGMVQTKWTHINKNYGILTKIQAFWLDAHFTVEQKGREYAGSFINFNGTAGIWRKQCIEDAGGWHHDTLTEDLDLSYRAQLKGWKFVYREEIESPAELPVLLPAIKSQQYRWNKGAAETAKKTLLKVLKSDLSFMHKVRAVFHLLNSSVFLVLLIAAVLSIPMLYIKAHHPELSPVFDLGSIFIIGFGAMGFFYWVAARSSHPKHTAAYFMINFPMFLTFSMGMALHNSIAVLEGYLGIKTPFIRTPKFNIKSKNDSWKGNHYLKFVFTPTTVLEGVLAVYFGFGMYSGIKLQDYGLMVFHLMLTLGFFFVFILSIRPFKNAG